MRATRRVQLRTRHGVDGYLERRRRPRRAARVRDRQEGNALIILDRNPATGVLTTRARRADLQRGRGGRGLPCSARGLDEPDGVAVSPDGRSVYVASPEGARRRGLFSRGRATGPCDKHCVGNRRVIQRYPRCVHQRPGSRGRRHHLSRTTAMSTRRSETATGAPSGESRGDIRPLRANADADGPASCGRLGPEHDRRRLRLDRRRPTDGRRVSRLGSDAADDPALRTAT